MYVRTSKELYLGLGIMWILLKLPCGTSDSSFACILINKKFILIDYWISLNQGIFHLFSMSKEKTLATIMPKITDDFLETGTELEIIVRRVMIWDKKFGVPFYF